MAVRWFSTDAANRAASSGALYALNTIGAAVGALLAGFVFLPRLGMSGTKWVGVAASVIAAASAGLLSARVGAR